MTTILLAIGVAALATSPAPSPARAEWQTPQTQTTPGAIQVNWLYGAFVPKDVPLEPLSLKQRRQLYIRQTFLTYGTYIKTALFTVSDQLNNKPSEWDDGFSGFGKRFASRYGQFAIQNTLSATGNALLRYEPRYERCRCSGAWPRVGHALVRNFVTYNETEHERRPQIAMYTAALGAGMITSTWRPGTGAWHQGYVSVLTQVAFGSMANVVGEFAPEIKRLIQRKK